MSILDEFALSDKVAIVTGASSGLGVAFAQGLAESGASVVLSARRDRPARVGRPVDPEPTAGGLRAVRARRHQTRILVPRWRGAAAVAEFGRVDILVNNAGIGQEAPYPATRETPEQFLSVMDVNPNGCYWMAQACPAGSCRAAAASSISPAS